MFIVSYVNKIGNRVLIFQTFDDKGAALDKANALLKSHASRHVNSAYAPYFENITVSEVTQGYEISLPPPLPPDVIVTPVSL